MFEMISTGGPLMWLLLGCSIVAVGVFLERLFLFHRSTINVGEFLQGLSNLIRKKNYAEALQVCSVTPGPVARVMHSAVIRHELPRSDLKEIVQESGQLEVPRLERYLSVLLTIAYIAPLIGLLGTILGLVDTFVKFNVISGQATIGDLSEGVYQSLITSAAGLAVAIPTFILYSYLAAFARNLMHDMERGGIEVVNIIEDNRNDDELIEFALGRENLKKASASSEDLKSGSEKS
ncbi:MAG: flagellar motor protein MotA [Verrucomicrobiales bacterium]|nr:flagellar motor protein MotA [Verrucomicrobiales bacterium]